VVKKYTVLDLIKDKGRVYEDSIINIEASICSGFYCWGPLAKWAVQKMASVFAVADPSGLAELEKRRLPPLFTLYSTCDRTGQRADFYADHPLVFVFFLAIVGVIVLIILSSYYTYWQDTNNTKVTSESPSLTIRCIYTLLLPVAMIGAPLSSIHAISEQLEIYNHLDGNLVISSFRGEWRRNVEFTEVISKPKMHHLDSGNGILVASVSYGNQPLANVEFSIMWQEARVKTWAMSDANGKVTLLLPMGTWHIREINISGADPIDGVNTLQLTSIGTQAIIPAGLELTLRPGVPEKLNLQLKPSIKLLFPESAKPKQTISINDVAIRWYPDPQAHTYQVRAIALKLKLFPRVVFPSNHYPILLLIFYS